MSGRRLHRPHVHGSERSMPMPPPSSTRPLDVEAALGAAGFTPFHRKAVAITGIAWTFVAMEILLVGFTLPLFGSLWGLSATWLGWIGASALAGSLVGSLLLGRLADQIGRRQIFQASILWYSILTALTALAWGPASLLTLRFLAGIGLGGMLVVDPSLLAEYLPPQRRGRYLVLLDFFWPIGLLIAIGLSWIFLDRLAEAAGVLGGITSQPISSESLAVSVEPSSSPRELLGGRLRATSLVIVLVWIALNVSYYGLFIWLPGVLTGEGRITLNPYVLLALVALAQFPGYAASLWLVEAWGRRPTLAAFLALGGASALTFAFARSTAVYVAALFFVGFFNLGAWGAVYPYTSELFPTRLRSTAFGMVEGVGKAAAIAGPYLFGYLLDTTGATVWSLTFVAAVMAAGALVTLLGRETRGAKLT